MIKGSESIVISIDEARDLLRAAQAWPGRVSLERLRELDDMDVFNAVLDLKDVVRQYDEEN